MSLRLFVVLVAAASTVLSAQQPSQGDWPQWRGPNRDGSAPSFTSPKGWPASLTQKWKVEVGLGYATPILVGDRVFMFSRRGSNEVVAALEASTGRQIWLSQYPAPYTLIKGAVPHGLGPKGTPAHGDGRLFTLGISGILSAFDAASGTLLWQKPAPANGPTFSTSQSPLFDRGLLIVHLGGDAVGALTAFDPATGSVRWQWNGDGPAYGSPVVADIAGVRQVVTPTFRHFVGVDAATGQLLWRRPFRVRNDVNSITPIVSGQTVFVAGENEGVLAMNVTKKGSEWAVEEVWRNDETFFRLSNMALVGDALFGLTTQGFGRYVILDARSGKILFLGEPRAADQAAFQKAGTQLLVLESDGELIVADGSNTTALTPLHRYRVADQPTWAAPAISGNRIFVKDESTLALWTIE